MATCELRGELKYRNGQTNEFIVKAGDNLKSIIAGVKKLNSEISEVLTDLVLQEKASTGNGKGDIHVDDGEEDDSDEDEDTKATVKTLTSNTGPPTKRMKTLRH